MHLSESTFMMFAGTVDFCPLLLELGIYLICLRHMAMYKFVSFD